MIAWKALLAGALSVAQVSTTHGDSLPQQQHPLVKQVLCLQGKGTAFRIGPNALLSVDHVTSKTFCTVDGVAVKATAEPGDFSVIDYPVRKTSHFAINCDGFVPGEYYFAIGYAHGRPIQRTVRLLATTMTSHGGMVILWGSPTVVPGMSGGPVLNTAGEVVGTVNMYNTVAPLSLSRQLKDTSVCAA